MKSIKTKFKENKQIRYATLFSIIIITLLLTGCGNLGKMGQGNPETDEYFHGTEGVRMEFVRGSPPPKMFFYSGLGDMAPENSFDLSVDLHNVGASHAIGAVYVSGFSPDFIQIEGVDIARTGTSDCYIEISAFSTSNIGGVFGCAGYGDLSIGGDGSFNINLAEESLDKVAGWLGFDDNVINNMGFGTDANGNWNFDLGLEFGSAYLAYGEALILVLSGINFENHNGFLFNEESGGVLKGDNYQYPGGEAGYVNMVGHIRDNWPQGLDHMDQKFMVTSCYGYTTHATPKVCIDPAPFDETKKICTPQDYSWSGSQGAPVAITGVKIDPTPRKIYFTITVQNVGGGEVFNPGYLERCSPYFPGRLDSRHKNTVYIGDIRIGRDRLDCNPASEVRLNEGRGTFTCSYDISFSTVKSAYETPLFIELWYGYQETKETTMYIKRAR